MGAGGGSFGGTVPPGPFQAARNNAACPHAAVPPIFEIMAKTKLPALPKKQIEKLMRACVSVVNGMTPRTRAAYLKASLRRIPKNLRPNLPKGKLEKFVKSGIKMSDLKAGHV